MYLPAFYFISYVTVNKLQGDMALGAWKQLELGCEHYHQKTIFGGENHFEQHVLPKLIRPTEDCRVFCLCHLVVRKELVW